ncbi:MAG: GatB/YqeY domain-containing protein [Clostridium fessum]
MSRVDVVRAAMVEAMKAKDKARKDSLSMLLSALKNAEIDKRSPLTEEEADAVVKKEDQADEGDSGTGSGEIVQGYPRGGHGHVWQFIRNLHRRI